MCGERFNLKYDMAKWLGRLISSSSLMALLLLFQFHKC